MAKVFEEEVTIDMIRYWAHNLPYDKLAVFYNRYAERFDKGMLNWPIEADDQEWILEEYEYEVIDFCKPTTFLVMAYYIDTDQRWGQSYTARTPFEAESFALADLEDGARICGVVKTEAAPADLYYTSNVEPQYEMK